MAAPFAIPVGLNPTAIGVEARWWLEAAHRAEEAGFETVWIWDHFISRGDLTDPLLECWTMLAAAAATTERIGVGSFVANNVNRHPAVLANIVGTLAALAPGRVELGIGIGGHPAEHEAYGMDFPPARERAARLEEAIAVLRALLGGGPVDYEGRYYRLRGATAFPLPDPTPRITVAGMRPAGARIAARLGDAWTCFADAYPALRPAFEAELERVGRSPREVPTIVGLEAGAVHEPLAELAARWQQAGAAELVIHDVGAAELDRLLDLL
jgi:alkanesulfonate monooxygenase SsuD/methylene tetrahydromethanopterin reductase-like flavin-dependent oxidoreductase (luciferase family)